MVFLIEGWNKNDFQVGGEHFNLGVFGINLKSVGNSLCSQKNFIRRVGFGIRPDEPNPTEPLNWALEQFDHPSNLIWPGRIYSQSEMLDIRIDFLDSEDSIQSSTKNPTEAREKRDALYHRTGRRFFESYEIAIRHHQAIYGEAHVFE